MIFILKKAFYSTIASVTILGVSVPVMAHGESPTEEPNVYELDLEADQDEMAEIAANADEYLVLKEDGTVELEATAEELDTTEDFLSQYYEGIDAINTAVEAGLVEVTEDFDLVPASEDEISTLSWSYEYDFPNDIFTLSNSAANSLETNLNSWSNAGTGVTTIAGYIGSRGVPQAGAVALASGLSTVGLNEMSNRVGNANNGNGIIIRSSWPNPFPIIESR